MAIPHRTESQGSSKTAAVAEAAGSDHRDLDGIEHLRQQYGRRHRTGMAAAFAALNRDHLAAKPDHLFGVLHRAHRGDAEDARVAEAADHLCVRPASETDGAHPVGVGKDNLDDFRRARLEAVKIHPEAVRRHVLQPCDCLAQFARLHHRARQKTERTGIARCSNEFRRRNPAHGCLDHRQAATKAQGQRGDERIGHD